MIKANEFRIGNYLLNTKGETDKVGIDALKYLLLYGESYNCQSKPIPLTEEWLVNFGFETGDGEGLEYYHKSDDQKIFGIDMMMKEPAHIWDASYTNSPCKYVHQLQNLYFALTGDELIYKP